MKKHLSRTLALLLVLVMVLSVLPVMSFATDAGEGAALTNGLPADGSYGVIYSCGEGYSYVMGYDITPEGTTSSLAVELTEDGEAIKSLPNGTAIVKFVKVSGSDNVYYFMLGDKYLVIKDLSSDAKERMALCDTPETGAKWTIIADQAGGTGMYNIKSEYKWNGRTDVYLEQYNGTKFCGYSYGSSTPQHFQFKFFATSADTDGRIGALQDAGALPEAGKSYVIYNAASGINGGVFGQPADETSAKQDLTVAEATMKNGTLAYNDIGDGGLIFTVSTLVAGSDTYYIFETGENYLSMSKNYVDESTNKTVNDEELIIEADLNDYGMWSLSAIDGGWLMKNKAAQWKGYPVYIEFFNDLFAGYSYNSSTPEIFAMQFLEMEDRYNCGYVVNPSVEFDDIAPAIGTDCLVKFVLNDLNEATAITASYWFDTASGARKTAEVDLNQKDGAFTVPTADMVNHSRLYLDVEVKDTMDITFHGTANVDIIDLPLITEVSPAANSATGDVKTPVIEVSFLNAKANPTVTMKLDGAAVTPTVSGEKATYTVPSALADGKHTVYVSVTRTDGKTAEKTWAFFVGEGGATLYFGQLHSHTSEYSDGAGTLEQAYEHAYEAEDVDFLIVTDHSNYFDTTKQNSTASYYDLSTLAKNAAGNTTKWEEARATAAEYNERYNGELLCAYGYEMTWSGGPGHTNTFNTYGTVSRNNTSLNNKTNYAGMLLYNDLMVYANQGKDVNGASLYNEDGSPKTEGVVTKYIEDAPVVSQFNHPGTTFGNFGDFTGCTALRDSVLNLVEVGNGEGKVGGSSYWPSIEQYDLALSMGWHLAPTNNQDNHKGNWGDSNTCRDVILTDDFTEAGIYRALAARRCYSTEDQNFEIYYTLTADGTDYTMGDIAAIDKDSQPKTVTLNFQMNDPDAKDVIGTVYVIGENGKVLGSKTYTGNSCKDSITVNNTDAYYYLKVVQKDGEISVTAPVWTSESTPVNVTVDTDASVAVQGTAENITATVTNGSESEVITVTKYTVEVDGTVVETNTMNEDLQPGGEKAIVINYTPAVDAEDKDYTQTITAYFTFTYKGESYTFNASKSELVINAKNAIYVGLDRGHTNFYVSGDYANCDTSFIQICADNGIICEYIQSGEMTKENLEKYKLVVITTPRVSDSVTPKTFTEAELKALQWYAVNGGSIINLGKSDRYDFDKTLGASNGYVVEDDSIYASAYLNNQINKAVGSKTRFADGIVVDNTWKTNEAYRINFYNDEAKGIDLFTDHWATEGMVTISNGTYQFYNGTSVIIDEADAGTVIPLVKGFDTSWVTEYTGTFTGSAYVPDYAKDPVIVPQGEVNLVTYEELSGGGYLVCSGTTFISTYDLKTDVTDAEQYANYVLVMNLLNHLKGGDAADTVTPIKEVHTKGQVNEEFTVEGWVTTNASDFDADTAFFDCIYVQDETRGINLFPVSGYYYIGEKVRAHGAVTYYCGEIELNLSPDYNGSIKVISNKLNVIEPKAVSCAVAMSDANIGNLVQISGVVKDIHRAEGVIDYIYVDDGSGTLGCLFINGYIMKDYKGLDEIEVGMSVTGVGIGSRDVDENSTTGAFIKRLRVRDRSEITAYWDPCAEYTDINRSAWYHSAADFVIENGFMGSTSTTKMTFEPNTKVTRCMVASILYRIAEGTPVEYSGAFTDVTEGKWYTEPIEWCAQNGLASGKGAGKFDPMGMVTRQELAVFMYKLAEYLGYDMSSSADLGAFSDAAKVPSWSRSYLEWAVGFGIISGQTNNGNTVLNPAAGAMRSELASILMRFMQNLKNLENKNDIVILYTNDVHCGVENSATSFGYAGLAAYKKEMQDKHDYVALVDAGDAVQGEAIGTLSKGEYLTDLMNFIGYDVATFGNHEFDYGMDQLAKLVNKAQFPYVSANFKYIGEGEPEVQAEPYVVKTFGDVKIAFVGISTPESLVKSTPTYFQNEAGEWIYTFCNDADGTALYAAVQEAVDAAKEEADYVVALAHLGDEEGSAPWRSADVIANTTGIDVVLDGHAHSVIPSANVKNKDGKDVILTSTGTKLANIGKLIITAKGELRTELIARADYDKTDASAEAALAEINAMNEHLLKSVVAHAGVDLTVSNPETNIRAVRYRETNLGDVCADAYRTVMDADIAFVNGGGIRADIKAGDITYEQIIAVHPFGNMACVVKATGSQILDALEMSSRNVTCDPETGKIDGECGGFLQVSGLKYTINTATESTVVTDTAAMFQDITGARRVCDVKVLNRETGEYEAIDPEKTYLLASHNYMLKQGGDGLNMFMNCELVQDETKIDNQVLIDYITSEAYKAAEEDGVYSDWTGEGRIKIINDPDYIPDKPIEGEDDEEPTYVYTGELSEGDKVVIYHPAQGKALANTLNGNKVNGVEVAVDNGVLTAAEGMALYTVHFVDETNFTLQLEDGTYLTSGETGNSMSFATEATVCSQWNIETVEGQEYVYIRNTGANYNGNYNQALEYYNGYTTYGIKTTDAYQFMFFKQVIPVEPVYGYVLNNEPAEGAKVIVYHPAQGKALANTLNGNKVNGIEVVVADGELTPAEGVAIYTVHYVDDKNFTLQMEDGTYLTSGETGNSMSFATEATVCSQWNIETIEGQEVVYVRNTGANYNGNYNQALEYYNGYTTYGIKTTDVYQFQFYVYTQTNGTECTVHEWVLDENTTVHATCTQPGTLAYVCKNCKAAKTLTEEALGHDYVLTGTDWVCSRCSDTVPATQHGYVKTNELVAGDKLIILVSGYAMTGSGITISGQTYRGFEADKAETTLDSVTYKEGYLVFDVETAPDEGTFYLRCDGKYLTMNAGVLDDLTLEDAPVIDEVYGDKSEWKLMEQGGNTLLRAAKLTRQSGSTGETCPYIIEFYSNSIYGWTVYPSTTDTAQYAVQLYKYIP